MRSASGETASRCGERYASCAGLALKAWPPSRHAPVLSNLGSIGPSLGLALAGPDVLHVVFFLDQRQQPERQEREHRDRHRDIIAAETDGNADGTGGPQARGCRRALHSRSMFEDRAAADETDTCDQAFDHF